MNIAKTKPPLSKKIIFLKNKNVGTTQLTKQCASRRITRK